MPNQNGQLIRDVYKLFDNHDAKAWTFFSPNVVFHVIGTDQPMRGLNEIQEGMKSWEQAFPDMKTEVKNFIEAGDWVIVESINHGTHKGILEGPNGEKLPATNRRVDVPACEIFRIENGKIVSWNLYWQSDVMMRQLGVFPGRAAA